MEVTKEEESTGLLNKILPPRLEDAGLEDCALPPDSIKEAFFKAASAVKSRAASIFTDDEDEEGTDYLQDPWPEKSKESSDEIIGGGALPEIAVQGNLVGVESGVYEPPGQCVVDKGGGVVEEGGDKVVVVGGGDEEEKEKDKECLKEGLKGLKIREKKGENGGDEEKKDEGGKPILTEGFV